MYNTALFLDSYRAASEDRAGIVALTDDHLLLIIADGVGGRENGGDAATRAVDLTRDLARRAASSNWSQPELWEEVLRSVDESLGDDPTCGETTLVALCLTPTHVVGASVGDSEAWWIDDTGAIQGITEEQRKPYLGSGSASPVTFELPVPSMGTLLIATDGLFKYTNASRIVRTVNQAGTDLQAIAAALRDLVRGSSGTLYDDFAVLLARPDLQGGQ